MNGGEQGINIFDAIDTISIQMQHRALELLGQLKEQTIDDVIVGQVIADLRAEEGKPVTAEVLGDRYASTRDSERDESTRTHLDQMSILAHSIHSLVQIHWLSIGRAAGLPLGEGAGTFFEESKNHIDGLQSEVARLALQSCLEDLTVRVLRD